MFRLRSSKVKDSHSADLSKHDQKYSDRISAGIVRGGIICVLTVMDDTIKSEDDVESIWVFRFWLLFRIERTILTRTEEKSNTLSERRYRNNEKSFNAGCP